MTHHMTVHLRKAKIRKQLKTTVKWQTFEKPENMREMYSRQSIVSVIHLFLIFRYFEFEILLNDYHELLFHVTARLLIRLMLISSCRFCISSVTFFKVGPR